MKIFKKRHSLILLLYILTVLPVAASRIVYPGGSCPVIVKAGTGFEILYENPEARKIDSVILVGPYNRVVLLPEEQQTGNFEYDSYTGAATDTRLAIRVPEGTYEELYDLIVKAGDITDLSRRSVKVVPEFRKIHRVLHFSDPHVTRQWIETPNGGYGKELELLDKFIGVANIIAPDFIMVTGDLIHDYTRLNADSRGWGGEVISGAENPPLAEEKFRNYFEGAQGFSGIRGFNAPVFSSTGNHDFYGYDKTEHHEISRQWNRLVGLRVYGFSYGGTRVIVTDDYLGDYVTDLPDQYRMTGLQGKVINDFLAHEGPGDFLIWGKHNHSLVDTAFMDQNRVRIILCGHKHTPKKNLIGKTPTLRIRPGVVCRSGNVTTWEESLGFFRLFTIYGKTFDHSKPLRFCSNPTAPYDQLDLNLTLDYRHPNDGTQNSNEVIVGNKFDVGFDNCRVRFVMTRGQYKVSGGRILQVIETGKLSVVDCEFDLKPKSESAIKIKSK